MSRPVAVEIRASFSSQEVINKGSNQTFGIVTVSVGCTQYVSGESLAHVVHRYLSALAQAQADGGDRVVDA